MSRASIVVKWRDEATDEGPFKWFLRGIKDDGVFYGEIQNMPKGGESFRNVEGRLSPSDTADLMRLVDEIEALAANMDVGEGSYTGLLGIGSPSSLKVLLIVRGEGDRSRAAEAYRELIGILQPYIRRFY